MRQTDGRTDRCSFVHSFRQMDGNSLLGALTKKRAGRVEKVRCENSRRRGRNENEKREGEGLQAKFGLGILG